MDAAGKAIPVTGSGRRALSDYLLYFAGYMLPRVATIVALSVYTRYLNPALFGHYALALTWVSLAVTVFLYWIHTSLQRLIPEKADGESSRALLGSGLTVAMIVVVVVSPLMWLGGRSVDPTLGIPTASAFIGQALFLLVQTTTIARQESRFFLILSGTESTIRVTLGVYAVTSGKSLATILAVNAVSGVFIFLVQAVRLYRLRQWYPTLQRRFLVEMWRHGGPLIVVWLGALALASLDRFMLEWLATASALGIYAAAYPLGEALVQSFATPMLATFSVRIFQVEAREGIEAARRYLDVLANWVAFALGVVMAIGIASAKPIRRVFLGAEYGGAERVIPYVCAGLVFWVYGSVAAKEFELRKQTAANIGPVAFAAIVNAGLNLILIPRFGGAGAAISTLFAYAIYFIAVGFVAGLNPLLTLARRGQLLVGALTAGLASSWLTRDMSRPFLQLVLSACLAAFAYVAIVSLLREPHAVRCWRFLSEFTARRRL